MKLLFDQNISYRIVNKIKETFPVSQQLKQLGLENSTDLAIWEYAKQNDYTIVTFDADFFDLSIVNGIPPKVVWLRIGNTSTTNLIQILEKKSKEIEEFITLKDLSSVGCLEIVD